MSTDNPVVGLPTPIWFASPAPLLEAIVQSSEDAIITKDLDGIIRSWNPAAQRMFGYTAAEIVGRSVLTLIPPALHSQEPFILSRLRAGQQIAHFETQRLAKDGRELTVSLTISPLKDRQGRVVGVSKIVRDITSQKHLDELRFRLAAIVESSDDAIMSKTLQGTVTSWNRSAERILGYSADEMIGSSILKIIPPELHPEENAILDMVRSGNRIEHFETVRMAKDGKRLNVSLTISPLRDGLGQIVGASKVLRNITGRKQMELSLLQAEKIAATGKMAATIAHEINNPLESVLNLIYLARTNIEDSEQAVGFLNSAESELVRAAHITKQTLGFYREHSAAVRIMLSTLVEDVLGIYKSRLAGAGIHIETYFAPSEKIVVRTGEMIQIISNLVTNAMYAMPRGGTMKASVQDAEEEGRLGLLMSIEDTGQGIAPENIDRVFEPFFTTREAVGTGIGLWVATQFVSGHDGTINVKSSVDPDSHGTRMSIFLPLDNPYARKLAPGQDRG